MKLHPLVVLIGLVALGCDDGGGPPDGLRGFADDQVIDERFV